MSRSVDIKANNGSDRLTFSSPSFCEKKLFSFVVTFEVSGARGAHEIYADTPTGDDSIEQFFAELARNWHGWDGEKKYTSLESDLEIIATSDSTGHTTLKVILRSSTYFWKVRGYIEIDSTDLNRISKELQMFANLD